MSKNVRLPDYLAAEVERLAVAEKRSLANMVQVLLEQALKMDPGTKRYPEDSPFPQPPLENEERGLRKPKLVSGKTPDAHFRPDPK